MTTVVYGAAIQGAEDRAERAHINKALIECIKSEGCTVAFEHTCGRTVEETAELLGEAIGPLPPVGIERTRYVRQKLIEADEAPGLNLKEYNDLEQAKTYVCQFLKNLGR